MKQSLYDVIVVGAGHSGLATSYFLKQSGLDHIVFERGRIGESWRSQRWDSFKFNTANKLNGLPGGHYKGSDPDGFCSPAEFVSSLEDYVNAFQLPVVEEVTVLSVEKMNSTGYFNVSVSDKNVIKQCQSRQVIIASGSMSEKLIPSIAGRISGPVKQLHCSEYREHSQLPSGAVLVIGGGQSGCQVAEDLLEAGRKVYLSTSMVARVPRRYRGKDIMDWLLMMKFFEARPEELPDPKMLDMKPPHLTGTGNGRKTLSLQSLAKKGAILLGRMENSDAENLFFQPNAGMHVKFADGFSEKVRNMIDEFVEKGQITAPPAEKDFDDLPDPNASCASSITTLNLAEHNIGSIIWAVGYRGNFSYIKLPVFDEKGSPRHREGVSAIDGLYFLGLPWLRKRKSATLLGINEDAEFIAGKADAFSKTGKTVALG